MRKGFGGLFFGLVLIGLIAIVVLMVQSSSASITYTPSTHRIYVTTTYQNIHENIYVADKAGTLELRSSTKTGTDASPVAHTYAFAPADYIMLGGSNNDFYVNVTLWDATLTSITVRIYGVDFYGVAQQEDIVITANGNYYTTLAYRGSNSSRVVLWVGSGSITLKVVQGQWGKIWKTGVNSYYINDSYINVNAIGIWVNDSNVSVSFNPFDTTTDYAYNIGFGSVRFNQCCFVNKLPGVVRFFYALSSSSTIVIENSSFRNDPPGYGMLLYIGNGYQRMVNNIFMNGADNFFTDRNSFWERNTFVNVNYSYSSGGGSTGSPAVNDMKVQDSNYGFRISAGNPFDVRNVTITDTNWLAEWAPGSAGTTIKYFRNMDTDVLNISIIGSTTAAPIALRQFGLHINVVNDSSVLSGVFVNVSEVNNETWAVAATHYLTTDASGDTVYKWVNRSRWEDTENMPGVNYSTIITVEKAGYIPLSFNVSNDLELDWVVLLKEIPVISVTENIVDAVGTFEYAWSPLYGILYGWANYTGSGGGSSDWLSLINPNPGYGGFGPGNSSDGTHSTNFIKKAVNLTTSLDVSMLNFTVLNETTLGVGEIIAQQLNSVNIFLLSGSTCGQNILVNNSNGDFPVILTKLGARMRLEMGGVGSYANGYFSVYNADLNGFPTGSALDVSNTVNITVLVGQWFLFNFSGNLLLENNTLYVFVFTVVNTHDCDLIWYDDPAGDSYAFGHAIKFSLGSWANVFDDGFCDFVFKLYGWSINGNISWGQCLNMSFLTNETGDGHWYEYANITVVSNGTVTVPFLNASGVDTYYWRCNYSNPNITGSTPVFSFTTVNTTSGIIPIGTNKISLNEIGVASSPMVLAGCMFGLILYRHKKKKQIT